MLLVKRPRWLSPLFSNTCQPVATDDATEILSAWQITKIDKLRREFIWQPLVWQGLATVCRKDIQDHFAT